MTAYADNKPGVLYRIADLFLRRKINITSMTVSETERSGVSRFTILVDTNKHVIEKTVKQLYRIIEIIKVFENSDQDLIVKEISLIKVHAKNLKARREIEDLTHLSNASIILVDRKFLVVEKSGTEEEISSLFKLLQPYGIKEFIRSGRIAVLKN